MNNSQNEQHISSGKHKDAQEVEYEDMELLERLETLREDMEDLRITTLAELIQRIEELHRKLLNNRQTRHQRGCLVCLLFNNFYAPPR